MVFQGKWRKKTPLQPLKFLDLLLFFVIYDCKLSIFFLASPNIIHDFTINRLVRIILKKMTGEKSEFDNQLCLSLKHFDVEQVQPSMSSYHGWNMLKVLVRGISCIRRCSSFLTPTCSALVTQALVLSHLDYCLAFLSGAATKDLSELQITVRQVWGGGTYASLS